MSSYVGVYLDPEYIKHYGKLGMKWGQHIFGSDRTTNKALKHLKKLKKRADKRKDKYEKADMKATNAFAKRSQDKFMKLAKDAARARVKSMKARRKHDKFEKAMTDFFSSVDISELSPETRELGKAYLQYMKGG